MVVVRGEGWGVRGEWWVVSDEEVGYPRGWGCKPKETAGPLCDGQVVGCLHMIWGKICDRD